MRRIACRIGQSAAEIDAGFDNLDRQWFGGRIKQADSGQRPRKTTANDDDDRGYAGTGNISEER